MSGLCPPVVARSLPEANDEIATLGPRTAIVSIGEPGTPEPYGFRQHNPLHFRLEFHDVLGDVLIDGIAAPSPDHVRRLLAHAPILRTAELVYCHCNAGISRSTAVAYILQCLWRGPGAEAECLRAVFLDRPQADPNPLLISFADSQLERHGAMVTALEHRTKESP